MNVMLKSVILKRFGSSVAFSLAVGVPESLVSRVIHGRFILDPASQEKWASALGCSIRIFDAEYPTMFMERMGQNLEW